MKQRILLASVFAAASLCTSCEKATVNPIPNRLSGTQQAETPVGFCVQRNFDSHWNYQFVSVDNGVTKQPCRLAFANDSLTVIAGNEADAGKPILYFSNAADELLVQVAAANGSTIFEQNVPANNPKLDLSQVVLPKDGTYSLSVYSLQRRRKSTVYLNSYFAYKK